ncbi:MAG: hypothetical protein ACI4KM_05340 [Oscillospiraceae bacterium]
MRAGKTAAAAMLSLICTLCGCNIENDENSSEFTPHTTAISSETTPAQTTTASTTVKTEPLQPDEVIPEAIQTPRVDGDRLSYSIMNVYADGDYYTVDISGVRIADADSAQLDTTYIKGELYGDFRLDLLKRGEIIDTLRINVPRDDRFLILESVTEGLSYGCELISNKREFGADNMPDLIQLDFFLINEGEVPQYARFFAVSGGKIVEVPVYSSGKEVAPYGTHFEMSEAGVMYQHIVARQPGGSYTVLKFEYTFDTENLCLNRAQVKFYG